MITDVAQRWRSGRASYRPAGEVIDPRAYEVAPIDGIGADRTAGDFIRAEHYSGSMPAARERVGLYRAGALVGVAVFSHPAQDKVLACLPCPKAEARQLRGPSPALVSRWRGRLPGTSWRDLPGAQRRLRRPSDPEDASAPAGRPRVLGADPLEDPGPGAGLETRG